MIFFFMKGEGGDGMGRDREKLPVFFAYFNSKQQLSNL